MEWVVISLNVAVLLVIFHIYFGLPNVLYLCTVYKNFYLSSRRTKLKALEISKLDSRAYLTWIDDNIHMNNGVYFSQFERGRRDWLWRMGCYAFNKEYQHNIVLTGLTARFRKEIGIFERFQVHTKWIYFDELHLYLEQRIVSTTNGFVHCIAYADLSLVNQKTGRRAKTADFITFVGLSEEEKKEMNKKCPESLLHWLDYLKNSSSEIRAESGLTPKK